MSGAVEVITGSRLHFGPLAVGEAAGRSFGGFGLMIDQPGFHILGSPAPRDRYLGPPEFQEKVALTLQRLRESTSRTPAGITIEVSSNVALHCGLGGGTQLALAAAQAALGPTAVPAIELARWTGRGARSAIGIHGYELGGLVVDGGKRPGSSLGALAVQRLFPSDWPILLWSPRDTAGLSGIEERAAFSRLNPMPAALTDRLCGLVLREILPSLSEHDCEGVSNGLRAYGDLVGGHFAPVQGGVFADPRAPAVVDWLTREGVRGVAQSSWGPTLAALAPSRDVAEDLLRRQPFRESDWSLTTVRNRGAELRPVREEPAAGRGKTP